MGHICCSSRSTTTTTSVHANAAAQPPLHATWDHASSTSPWNDANADPDWPTSFSSNAPIQPLISCNNNNIIIIIISQISFFSNVGISLLVNGSSCLPPWNLQIQERGQCPSPKLSLYMWGRTSHFQKFKSLPFYLFLDFEMKVPGNSALRCQLIFLLCYCEIFYFSPLSLRSCGLNLCGFSCDCSDKKRVTVPRPHKSSYFLCFFTAC